MLAGYVERRKRIVSAIRYALRNLKEELYSQQKAWLQDELKSLQCESRVGVNRKDISCEHFKI